MLTLLLLTPFSFLCYALYSGEYSRNFLYSFLIFSLIYVLLLVLILKPQWSIYLFFIIWIVVPKYMRALPIIGKFDLPGLGIFDLVHSVAALTVGLVLITRRVRWKEIKAPQGLKRFYILFFITAFLTTIFSLFLRNLWNITFSQEFNLNYWLRNLSYLFYGLIIFYALLAYIKEVRQIETILGVFCFGGALLIIESIFIYKLKISSFFAEYATFEEGQFQSLFFLDPLLVGIFCILALGSSLYFMQAYKKNYLLFFIILLFVPIMATYSKSILGASLVVLMFFLYMLKRKYFFVFLVILILILFWMGNMQDLFYKITSFLGGRVRTEYWSEGTATSRIGAYFRTIDVLIFSFPFGIGEGMIQWFTGSSVPTYLGGFISDFNAQNMYWGMASGIKPTSSHNIYMQFITEHGLLGIIVLVYFIYLISQNFRIFMKNYISKTRDKILQVCIYASLFGIAFFHFWDSAYKLYFIYFTYFYFTFLLRELDKSDSSITS